MIGITKSGKSLSIMNRFWTLLIKPNGTIAKWLLFFLLASIVAFSYLGYLDPIKSYLDSQSLTFKVGELQFSIYKILKGIVALIILFWITSIISAVGEKNIRKIKKIQSSNRSLITKIFQIFIYFLAFIIGLDVLGVDLTALAIFSGAVGIGVGIGLQKIASNFISGLILLFEKSVEEDDLVEFKGVYGYVRKTGARYTLVETFDGKEVMIPNEDFITSQVVNWTYSNTKGRIQIPIGVSYKSDIELARKLILEAADEHPLCSNDPGPECYLREYGNSSVNFLLFFWVDDIIKGRYKPQSEVMFSIWKKFHDNNIEIPFPQRDLHVKGPIEVTKK